jgi:hypothetical protein
MQSSLAPHPSGWQPSEHAVRRSPPSDPSEAVPSLGRARVNSFVQSVLDCMIQTMPATTSGTESGSSSRRPTLRLDWSDVSRAECHAARPTSLHAPFRPRSGQSIIAVRAWVRVG